MKVAPHRATFFMKWNLCACIAELMFAIII
jgi:hypothetical protein